MNGKKTKNEYNLSKANKLLERSMYFDNKGYLSNVDSTKKVY